MVVFQRNIITQLYCNVQRMILLSNKVHGIGATKIFTNDNTDAPLLHAATPFIPSRLSRVSCCFVIIFCGPLYLKRKACLLYGAEKKVVDWHRSQGSPCERRQGVGKVGGLRR